jgi:lipopolysaccharide transport system ATP-binding protein
MDLGNARGKPVRIVLDRVSLEVPVFIQRAHSTKTWVSTLFGAAMQRPKREFRTLLSDISFSLDEGDRIALLGRNGAGKSTLLHILTGAYLPTKGTVRVSGTRQALLNIALGFNNEATVRENIFLRGSAMGIHASHLIDLIEPVLEFADLRRVSNERLGTLSAGQRLRLGFAISTSIQRDIMLLDEWIGAGDTDFLRKARARMKDRVDGSKILVLASHSIELVKNVCNKGLVMESGRVVYLGSIADALNFYKEMMSPTNAPIEASPGSASATAGEFVQRRLGNGLDELLNIPFDHHVIFDNSSKSDTGALVRKVYMEFAGVKAHDVINMLFAGSLIDRDASWEEASGRSRIRWKTNDGVEIRVTLSPVMPGRPVLPGSEGALHIEAVSPIQA